MIEFCTKKRMAFAIVILVGVSFVVLLFESIMSVENKLKKMNEMTENMGEVTDANTTFGCWSDPHNKYRVTKECSSCSQFDKKAVKNCAPTGYKEVVECTYPSGASKLVYRSCRKPYDIERRHFFTFEAVCVVVTCLAYSSVYFRQKKLDKELLEKVHKQIASGV